MNFWILTFFPVDENYKKIIYFWCRAIGWQARCFYSFSRIIRFVLQGFAKIYWFLPNLHISKFNGDFELVKKWMIIRGFVGMSELFCILHSRWWNRWLKHIRCRQNYNRHLKKMPSSAFLPLGHHSRSSQGSQHEHLRHSVCSEQSKMMLFIF